jgi:exodeoxyribonuclease VII large subunit
MSPLKILDRGYALVFDSAGRLVKDATQVNRGDEISARLARGTIISTVKRKQ